MTNEKRFVLETLKSLEEKHNVKVLYCTKSGSKLYGTDNPNSDTDYKFVFAPSKEDLLLKRDVEFLKVGSDSKEKNGPEDVDFDGSSVHKFVNLLAKSETGAVDVLFSMFREDTVMYEDKNFTDLMKKEYKQTLNKNMKAFVGYAVGQTKKFGIKGARYDELKEFVEHLKSFSYSKSMDAKLGDYFSEFRQHLAQKNYKYVKFVMAQGGRSNKGNTQVEYLSVLGKLFEGTVGPGYFLERVTQLFEQFGNRTKTVAQTESKTDFKALSHALRVAMEVEELLETGFVKFPLQYADRLKQVKAGLVDVEEALNEVQDTLGRVDVLLLNTTLPEESNKDFLDAVVLKTLGVDWS